MSIETQIDVAFEGAKLKMAERMLRAVVLLQTQHMNRVSKPAGKVGKKWVEVSKPGEYPRLRTGEGRSGVTYAPTTPQGIVDEGMIARVGQRVNSRHMIHLEFGSYTTLGVRIKFNRLGYRKTAQDLRPLVLALLTGKAGGA